MYVWTSVCLVRNKEAVQVKRVPWLIGVVLSLIVAAITGVHVVGPSAGAAEALPQATAYNAGGTPYSFRAIRLDNGHVGLAYGIGTFPNIAWNPYVDIGGSVSYATDISVVALIDRVWVFARFSNPVDGTAQLYERHGFPGDLANGQGGGFTDIWYHWR